MSKIWHAGFLVLAWLAAGCGGGARQQAAPAQAPPTRVAAEPAAPALDCAAICRAATATSTVPPKSPCGPGRGDLSGTVTDAGGKPLAEAFVAAQSSCGLFYSTSRPDGSFTLSNLPQGPYLVAARWKGQLVEGQGAVDPAASPGHVELRFGKSAVAAAPADDLAKCDCAAAR